MFVRSLIACIFAISLSSCAFTTPDIQPAADGVVSRDPRSWYIRESSMSLVHPLADPNGIWLLPVPPDGFVVYVLTPFRAVGRPSVIVVTYRIVASADALPVSYEASASPCREHNPCTPVAVFHVCIEQRGDDMRSETGRWWFKGGFRLTETSDASYTAQSFVADGQIHTVTIPLIAGEWTSVTGRGSPADFEVALANIGYVGISFGGTDYFAQGVAVRQGSVQFEMIDFQVQ